MELSEQKKIYVGLSGGVDSSVAAALLKEEGHDVHAVYLKVWSPDLENLMRGCPWEEDVRYAEGTAKHLGIPFVVWDVSKEYFDHVVDYFVAEHAQGHTPNPDIMCNREIKFGIFLERALQEGADAIATGHYVRKFQISNFKFQMLMARDANKDQSYFLYALNQEQLSRALFPIGDYTKPEVRRMAKELRLPTAARKDSQGICFLGKIPVREFLKLRIQEHAGALVTTGGKVIGSHEGVEFYTIGQRHGIGSKGGGTAYYVAGKDLVSNRVVVAESNDAPELHRQEIEVSDVHWISGVPPEFPLSCMARIRYRQPLQLCRVVEQNDADSTQKNAESLRPSALASAPVCAAFAEPQRAVTPGQACVFYRGEEMLGGGIIE